MEYQVKLMGQVHSTHKTKADAIKAAEEFDRCQPNTSPHVIAHEISGTYESHTCVWPERGETYSN